MGEVNIVTCLIGIMGIGYGIYTFIMRKKSPGSFWKLEPMKKFWGEKLGYGIHVVGYTVVPILVGLIVLIKGLMGVSLF
jgi:hypothetical protein